MVFFHVSFLSKYFTLVFIGSTTSQKNNMDLKRTLYRNLNCMYIIIICAVYLKADVKRMKGLDNLCLFNSNQRTFSYWKSWKIDIFRCSSRNSFRSNTFSLFFNDVDIECRWPQILANVRCNEDIQTVQSDILNISLSQNVDMLWYFSDVIHC